MNISISRKRKADCCQILGVPLDADETLVKKAYRRLALELHPDRISNCGLKDEAGKKFQEISDAYSTLQGTNLELNHLKSNFSPHIQSALDTLFDSKSSSIYNLHSYSHSNVATDLPLHLRSIPKRGQSLKAVLHLSIDESLHGCTKSFEYSRNLNCLDCNGTGNLLNSPPLSCRDCNGTGLRTTLINGLHLNIAQNTISTICRSCHSTGLIGPKNCIRCHGTGTIAEIKAQAVQVPAGISTGTKIIFEHEGDEGHDGGLAGDLVLWFEVEGTPLAISDVPAVRKRGRKPGSGRKSIIPPSPTVISV